MVVRLKGALTMLRRATGQEAAPTASSDKQSSRGGIHGTNRPVDMHAIQGALDQHEEFFSWYASFLRNELVPTASYQRHITSLKASAAIFAPRRDLPGGPEAFDMVMGASLFRDLAWIRSVLDLIMNSFDDVREATTALLMSFPEDLVKQVLPGEEANKMASLQDMLQEFCRRADKHASRTGRADHANGAARAKGLLCAWTRGLHAKLDILKSVLDVLEDKLSLAEEDLGNAAIGDPVHGSFASVR